MAENAEIFRNLNPTNNFAEYLTDGKVISNFRTTTFCHDIIGEVTKVIVSTRDKKVLNLEIKVKDDSNWALVAWDDEADLLQNDFIVNNVYHFDGLYVQAVKKNPNSVPDYSCGKLFKFTIKSNTIVTNLTKLYSLNQEPANTLPNIQDIVVYEKIQECVDQNFKKGVPVGLKVYVRAPFVQGNPEIPLRWGALTDGEIKITTTVKDYSDPLVKFEAGQKVIAYGKVFEYRDKAAFEISHVKDIKVIEHERKTQQELREIVKTPQKPNLPSTRRTDGSVVKKLKMEES